MLRIKIYISILNSQRSLVLFQVYKQAVTDSDWMDTNVCTIESPSLRKGIKKPI